MPVTKVRKLTEKDSARIQCGQTLNKEFDRCSRPATHCEQWESSMPTKPVTHSMSFHYFCDEHVKANRF